jgi:thioredoxin-like negative regulator of GroEL
VNVAVEPDLVEQCKIAATPTFVMYLEGQEIDRLEGAPDTVAAVVRALTEPFAFGDEAQP